MKLNRIELKKVIYDFNSVSNRLIKADYQDYQGVLIKFLGFVSCSGSRKMSANGSMEMSENILGVRGSLGQIGRAKLKSSLIMTVTFLSN